VLYPVASLFNVPTCKFEPLWLIFFYGATACNATHGISKTLLSSVRPSVKRVDGDKTKETCAHVKEFYDKKNDW